MRIIVSCMLCHEELKDNNSNIYHYKAELKDDGLYHLKCPQGHESTLCLTELRFQLLYELAANAIVDGYYREAVTSFSSALERFYEFYVEIICLKNGLSATELAKAQKLVSSQSERQLGAYIFVYLIENSNHPKLLPDKSVKFRNEVVHKGKIPTKPEAIEYGEIVLEIITPVLEKLKAKYQEQVLKYINSYTENLKQKTKDVEKAFISSTKTTIRVIPVPFLNPETSNLHNTLKRLEGYRMP